MKPYGVETTEKTIKIGISYQKHPNFGWGVFAFVRIF